MDRPSAWYATPAFWLSLAAAIVAALLASGVFPSDSVPQKLMGAVSSVLAMFGFRAGRQDVSDAYQMNPPSAK